MKTLSAATIVAIGALTLNGVAGASETATNVRCTGCVNNADINTGAVTGSKIAEAAVSGGKIGTGAVTASKIGTGAVTESKIGTGAVTGNKIKDGAVGANKLGTESVYESKIVGGAVSENKIRSNAVTEPKIADGAITAAKLAPDLLSRAISRAIVVRDATGATLPILVTDVVMVPGGQTSLVGVYFYDGSPVNIRMQNPSAITSTSERVVYSDIDCQGAAYLDTSVPRDRPVYSDYIFTSRQLVLALNKIYEIPDGSRVGIYSYQSYTNPASGGCFSPVRGDTTSSGRTLIEVEQIVVPLTAVYE